MEDGRVGPIFFQYPAFQEATFYRLPCARRSVPVQDLTKPEAIRHTIMELEFVIGLAQKSCQLLI